MPLKTLIYVSNGRGARSIDDMRDFLPRAVTANWNNGISGFIVFDGVHYLHRIEGRRMNVERLMARIVMDQRHSGIRIVLDRRARRNFLGFAVGVLYDIECTDEIERLVTGGQINAEGVEGLCAEVMAKAESFL